jgi:glycosyltransferase involved in cell wall biosynthesis
MKKQNRFVIISTAYNKSKWVRFNINSVKQQSYPNYFAAYGYDKSTDDTLEHLLDAVGSDPNFLIYHNPNPGCFLNCFMGTYKHLKEIGKIEPDDIIIEIDGDDWLLHPFIFQYLNQIYQDDNIWMTYGQYIHYPSGELGGHYELELNDYVDQTNSYRMNVFPYSHLKTYKAFLLDNVTDDDLIDPTTGKYFNAAADFALCMPLVEQAGKNRIFKVPEVLYVYNTSEDLESETNNRVELQKEVEFRIRQIKPKQKL